MKKRLKQNAKLLVSLEKELHSRRVEAIHTIIRLAGDDPLREGMLETPERVVKAFAELFSGYKDDPEKILKTFKDGAAKYDEMVVVRDIEFTSWCEHHLLPFTGRAHVGYLPKGKIVGLSKFGRLVDCFAKRYTVQERMTVQIVEALESVLKPKGCGAVVVATHSCMSCRGVRKQNAETVTSHLSGAFKTNATTRGEFLKLCLEKR